MKTIVKMIFGSQLYGTSTPDSDTDYKIVFMPSQEQILLGEIPKGKNKTTKDDISQKNTSEDVDTEYYSLHYFIKLALEGQTAALDMIHAPDQFILEKNHIWDSIIKNKEKFYTKNLKAFVGYARQQASKYGIKGSRLDAAKEVYEILKQFDPSDRLEDTFNILPVNDYCMFINRPESTITEYEVCGRKLQSTAKIDYCLKIVKTFYDNYGARAKQAAENKGIDWKAVSHAVRAAMQLKMLYTIGTIIFPLPEADLLLKIKKGELDYSTIVSPLLENLVDEVTELSKSSDLPEKPDYEYWKGFLLFHAREQIL